MLASDTRIGVSLERLLCRWSKKHFALRSGH